MANLPSGEVTRLLQQIGSGDSDAWSDLIPLVEDELRKVARHSIGKAPPHQTMTATSLINEAYIRLAGTTPWTGRAHFFSAAARAMRNVLVDESRRRQRLKRGGDWQRVTLGEPIAHTEPAVDYLTLDEALERLKALSPRQHEVVMLRHFAGCGIDEVAEMLNVSSSTVDRDWSYARTWLFRELKAGGEEARGE